MSINKKGFLGEQIQEFSRNIINNNKELFDLCFDFNQVAHDVKFRFPIDSEDDRAIIATCLFIRILNGFQAVVILAKYGLSIESNMILRNLFQTLCILKRVVENEEFHRKYVLADLVQRRRLFNVAREDPDPVFDELRNDAHEYIKKLSNEIQELEVEEYSVEKLAELANWKSFYNTFYRLKSADTHTSPRSLEEYLAADGENNIRSIKWGPSDEGINQTLFTSIDFLRMALGLAIEFFDVEGLEKLQSLYTREQELHRKLGLSE